MAGPRTSKLTAPLLALLVLANGGAAPGDDTRTKASDWPAGRSGGSRVVVFLKEQCSGDHGGEPAEDYKVGLYRYMKKKGVTMADVDVSFLPKSAVCETKSRGLSAILDALAQDATRALIGSLGEDLCDVTSRLADMWGKPLLSWSCPQVTKGTQRLVPSLEETANAIVAVAKTLAWRSIVIITSDVGWWPVLANKIEVGLQELGIAPRHLYWENQSLRGLHSAHARVIILCASLRSSTGETILQAIDSLKLSQAILLAIDVSSFIPFLPRMTSGVPREDILTEEVLNDDPSARDFSDPSPAVNAANIKISLPSSIRNNNRDVVRSAGDSKSNNPSENRSVFVDSRSNYSSVHKSSLLKFKIKLVLDNVRNISNKKENMISKKNSTHFYESKIEKSETETPAEDSTASDGNFTIADYHKNNNHISESLPIDPQSDSRSEPYAKYSDSSTGLPGRDSRENFTGSRASSIYGQRDEDGTLNTDSRKKNKFLSMSQSDGSFRGEHNGSAVSDGEAGPGEPPPWRKANFHNSNETVGDENGKKKESATGNLVLNREHPYSGFYNDPDTITSGLRSHLVFKKHLFEKLSRTKRSWSQNRYEMFENISIDMKRSFMILTSIDSKNSVSDVFVEKSNRNELFEHILEGLHTVTSGNTDNKTGKVFKFLFLDWKEEIQEEESEDETARSHWRPLIILQSTENMSRKHGQGETFQRGDVSLNILRVQPHFDEWFQIKRVEFEDDSCYGDFCIRAQIKVNSTQIIIIVSGALLFCGLTIGIALIVRNVLLKKRLSKGPNKIVLTATDFVFPQVPDSRRVDEGIEAMLCCWLQQLQEFGGPEVDKPDLLKGSVGSLGGVGAPGAHNRGPSSNGSLARNNFIMDHRIRYNGDLVQVKNLPIVGTFELKSKAMDCLILTHGLRHENLNPFIGCLTDPTRPALVHEHCSRGSLEDVLMMDEIKLDWSFRLSLLTDLVRGMKYLHSTPLKVHGNLTSRNCVIDARWVLKVTDYGLPAFYEAQGIPAPAKTPRDLLWTAPELLRHCGLRRRGTQPGDVYSFGIIMQEVVVRGEPFCMLALSSEEIIEKVKKPPPLIRPSVSKGAAPPEAIHIMRQCWTEQAEMRPDFPQVHDLFRKLNHGRKVNFVDTMFQMLEKYSNNLEELIRERTEQLDMEKKKTEQLLNRMLPSYVADKLKLGMPVDPEEFSEVSIYFSDIVGFTAISAHCTPFQVVDLLNDLYTCFDATINAYNVYKVETIGDAYMVVGGLPVRVADHAEQIATMALDLLHQSGRFKIRHLPRTPLHLRIGLHTGPCCAGVVGLTMPRYCLFGDTVNTASRMESTGSAWRIHLSQTTRDKLEAAGGYALEYRGRTEVKGKGKMPTYWLLGKAGFDKKLPTPPPLGLEESLMIDRNPSPRLEELTSSEATGGQVSPCPPASDFEKPLSNHFSIDKTFFSVEKPCSPSPSPIENNGVNLNTQDTFLPRVINGERKKPKVMETPNNSQDQGESIIPTITTQSSDDPQVVFDQISKAELPITNILHHNKLQIGVNQLPQYTLGTPVSASEVAAALLGSSTSLVSNRYKDISKYKRSLMIEAHDLSSPYNHYRCLSPSDSNIHQLSHGKILGEPRQNAGRLLKRQFSLDRADDSGSAVLESSLASQSNPRIQPRLCKQNSAGAAPDLERIEEVPLVLTSPKSYKRRLESTATFPSSSKSISTESLVIAQR